MKISPIAYSPAQNYQNLSRKKNLQKVEMPQTSNLNFKGGSSGFWSLVGTVVGGAAGAILSGGILIPFIGAGIGSMAGGIYGQKDEPQSDQYGRPYYDSEYSGYDYLG